LQKSAMPPLVTVAVLSWNRLHYLRATLESARRCLAYPNLEWIVSDNESEEPGLRDYLESLTWLDRRLYRRQSHADAMNQILAEARGRYLLLWPDDVQFVVAGSWMSDLIEILEAQPGIGSVSLDALRRQTLQRVFAARAGVGARLRELYWYRTRFRVPSVFSSNGGFQVRTLGWRASGICGSGIPSLTRTEVWRKLGPWRAAKRSSTGLKDSSMGAEEDMFARFHLSKMPLQTAIPCLPVAADIVTDPTGCKAKVRGAFRYGVYMPPQSSDGLYYAIRDMQEFAGVLTGVPLSFAEVVKPLGFHIPTDEYGDRLKSAINTSVVFDIRNNCEVKYPLLLPPR
jgi:hypothetical protein